MRHFFLHRDAIRSHDPAITGPDVKHIRTVLRLKPGDEIALFDGEGSQYRARIEKFSPGAVHLSILDQQASSAEPSVDIAIGQALLKTRKLDRIVRQITELGATAFLPFVAERSVARPSPERLRDRRHRWETIVREALKQCGRSRTPVIGTVSTLEGLLELSHDYDKKIIFHNDKSPGDSSLYGGALQSESRKVESVLALIGPEGGFTDSEVALALRSGFSCVSLGPRTLKADTAAVAVAAILQYGFGDMGRQGKSQKCLDTNGTF
jgi:16S rRNA (uracil1498-N3)-methyltransferase